jgi:hypothetical protein
MPPRRTEILFFRSLQICGVSSCAEADLAGLDRHVGSGASREAFRAEPAVGDHSRVEAAALTFTGSADRAAQDRAEFDEALAIEAHPCGSRRPASPVSRQTRRLI